LTFYIIIRENRINNFDKLLDTFSDRSKKTIMKEIIAANLIRYRKGLHLSQEQLAEQAGVTRQTINNYEKAKTLPDSKALSTLARVLGVTLDDLLRAESDKLPNFRFRAHASFGQNPQFVAQVMRILATYNALEQAVGLPPYTPESTPCHQVEGNQKHIQSIAAQFRHRLGLGDAPIANLFQSVETIGLKVLRQPIPIKGFFGLSACSDAEGAFILINTQEITIERQLFTLAHEIGHLIFHRVEYQDTLMEQGNQEEEKAREKVADYFAGHLLVPQTEFEQIYQLTQDIVKLKQHFRVSYQVILSRLAEMEIIDYAKEKAKICAIYKKRNNGTPLQNSMELPPALEIKEFPENERYVRLIWNALKLCKISEMKAAELLNLTVEELRVRRQQNEVYAVS
jgi:Zn-dependent peptidase ImmA (M78 family)/transcriptional regulator with XRE-family HTH domain